MRFDANDAGPVDISRIVKFIWAVTGPDQQILFGGIVRPFACSLNILPDIGAAV